MQPPTPPALFIIGGEESRDQSEGIRVGKRRPCQRPERSQLAPRLVLARPRPRLTWPSFFHHHSQHVEAPVTEIPCGWKQCGGEYRSDAGWGMRMQRAIIRRSSSDGDPQHLEKSALHSLASRSNNLRRWKGIEDGHWPTTSCLSGKKNGQRLQLVQY